MRWHRPAPAQPSPAALPSHQGGRCMAGGGVFAWVTHAQYDSGGAGWPLRRFGSGSVRPRDRVTTSWADRTGSRERPSCKQGGECPDVAGKGRGTLSWSPGLAWPRAAYTRPAALSRRPPALTAWTGPRLASLRPLGCCGLALPVLRSRSPSRLPVLSRLPPRPAPLPPGCSFPFSPFSAALCRFPPFPARF